MPCGSCGKRNIQIQNIQKPSSSVQRRLVNPVTSKQQGILCPICHSPMRGLHKYDNQIKKVIKAWYCTNASCANSKGTQQ